MDHDPNAVLDYSVDWKYKSPASRATGTNPDGWLAAGETISSSTWTVPTGLTQLGPATSPTAPAPSQVDGKATIWLTGGTAGDTYKLTNKIVTSAGRTDERSIQIDVKNR